jgi:hypothetical protein
MHTHLSRASLLTKKKIKRKGKKTMNDINSKNNMISTQEKWMKKMEDQHQKRKVEQRFSFSKLKNK